MKVEAHFTKGELDMGESHKPILARPLAKTKQEARSCKCLQVGGLSKISCKIMQDDF